MKKKRRPVPTPVKVVARIDRIIKTEPERITLSKLREWQSFFESAHEYVLDKYFDEPDPNVKRTLQKSTMAFFQLLEEAEERISKLDKEQLSENREYDWRLIINTMYNLYLVSKPYSSGIPDELNLYFTENDNGS